MVLATGAWVTGIHAVQPVLPGPATTYEVLAERLNRRIDETDWLGGRVSLSVRHATLPIVVLDRDADQSAPIGELTQLVTAAAALDVLGPDFKFTTELLAVGADEKNRTATAVVIRGSGDPTFSTRYSKRRNDVWDPLDEWVQILRKTGLRKIDGPVIGDDFAFEEDKVPEGWPADRLGEAEYPSISALNFNHNVVELTWTAGKEVGVAPELSIFPNFDRYVFVSNLVRVYASSDARANWASRQYSRNPEGNLISAKGLIATRQRETDKAAIDDPARFFAEAMRERMVRGKIDIVGPAASRRDMPNGRIHGRHQSIAIRFSPPLAEMLATMLRHDEALEAEVILRALGKRSGGSETAATAAAGIETIGRFLDRMHLPGPVGYFTEGSGRSDLNRFTTGALAGMLHRAIANAAWGERFDALLPRSGSEGTLADRFMSPNGKRSAIWAKTGSNEQSESAAGKAETRTGDTLVFAAVVEGSRLPPQVVRNNLDALLLELTQ